jgi:squalene synthase HpnC
MTFLESPPASAPGNRPSSPPGHPSASTLDEPAASQPGNPLADRAVEDVLRCVPGENFPVAPFVVPADVRRHLSALYGFARFVDDVGDATDVDTADRLRALEAIDADLDRIWAGEPRLPVLRALAPTVRERSLPAAPFRALVEANRQDQTVARYETVDELLDYCTKSADPVGRLVLHLFGVATPRRVELSDRICTALQIVEHCQDVAEDYARGRIYLPAEDLRRFGVAEDDLRRPAAGTAVRELMTFQIDRAARILREGTPLVGTVHGRLRLLLSGFVGGGRAAIAAVRRADHDVLAAGAPRAPKRAVAWHAARVFGDAAVRARPAGRGRPARGTEEDR